MAIDFPDSPSNNDIYTVNGKRWIYSNGKWSIYGSTSPDATASDTEPTGVGDGHIWYRSDQSQTLIRYDNTWVEIGSAGGFDNASTSFPTSLDSATGFAAVEALQAKVGVNSSAVTTSLDYKVAQLEELGSVQTYTPTWTATGGTPTIGNGTLTGKYAVINNWCVGEIKMTLGSTSSFSGTSEWRWSLPVAAVNQIGTFPAIGASLIVDTGVSIYRGIVVYVPVNNVGVYPADNSPFSVAPTVPFTWTTNEEIYITFGYEVA
jgi:hypothetical protein